MEHNLITELSDDRLDELLAYTPNFTAENLDNIKKRCLQQKANKRKTGRRILLAAAIATAMITLSGIALAVSTGFDFGSFYNSLFNNPDVGERFEIGQTAVSNGIEITLLSAVVDRYQAYLTIEIRDLEGDRLSDSMNVLNDSLPRGHLIITGPVIYDKYENKATLALTVLYVRNIAELGTASLHINGIQNIEVWTEHVYEVIRGEWRIDFTVEQAMQNRILIAYPDASPVIAKLEVTCSPVRTSIRFTAHGAVISENGYWTRLVDGYDEMTDSDKIDVQSVFGSEIGDYYRSFDKPFLTLDDGSIITLEYPNEVFDWLGGSVWFPTEYYDIDSLMSITFCGVEYFFSHSP
jgi:hypothetical protein